MKKLILILILATGLSGYAQQDPMYSQYWVNAAVINPAQTAVNGNTSLNLTGRYQWVGMKGAPQTHSLSFMTQQSKGVGLGGSYVFDRLGPLTSNTLNIDVAYHVRLSNDWYASAGARLSGTFTQINLTDLYTAQANDPAFAQNLSSGFRPNIGYGILLHNDHFYVGYGEPRSLDYDLSKTDYMNVKIKTHRFGYIGYNFRINDDLELRPSLLFRHVSNAPLQSDINLAAGFMKKFTAGVCYRTGDGLGTMVGLEIAEKLRFYYCYDYPLSQIAQASRQTHQFTLVYDFRKKETGSSLKFFD